MSPAEGFLLSRIDGSTPWTMLRQIGGIAPEEVDRCLQRWVSEGIVVVDGDRVQRAGRMPRGGSPQGAEARPDPGPRIDLSAIDRSLDLSLELQRRILEFEGSLERPYHELLGVDRDVDARGIKRAYFTLSKEFHPDRYFRREIGGFGVRLDRIFKKVVEAYELLMDPTTRAELERSMASRPAPAPEPEPLSAAAGAPSPRRSGARKAPRRQTSLDRLRRRFRIPDEVLAERKLKARQFCDSAQVAVFKERWLEAAASVRLAIAFDPWNGEYKERFGEIQARVHQVRAAELLEQADASMGARALGEALRLYEEALHYRPVDPELNDRAAALALETGDLERAREYAERACELEPDVGGYHRSLGLVYRQEGLREKAKAAFETALRLDPDDSKAKQELLKIRRNRRSGGVR